MLYDSFRNSINNCGISIGLSLSLSSFLFLNFLYLNVASSLGDVRVVSGTSGSRNDLPYLRGILVEHDLLYIFPLRTKVKSPIVVLVANSILN